MRLVGMPLDDTVTYSYIGCPSGCVIDSDTDASYLVLPEIVSEIVIVG